MTKLKNTEMAKIIFLNGSGSSGKTTLAKAIQHLSDEPWLRFSIDMFIDMMPSQYIAFGEKATEGYFHFASGQNEHGQIVQVEGGPLGEQVFNAIPEIARILADKGNNLIIDEVLLNDDLLKSYVKALEQHTVYFIGVTCELATMQEREILRGDRALGLANDQIKRVHTGVCQYDLIANTTSRSPFIVVRQILNYINTTPNPQGFIKMRMNG